LIPTGIRMIVRFNSHATLSQIPLAHQPIRRKYAARTSSDGL
jgi:hypothetical protein